MLHVSPMYQIDEGFGNWGGFGFLFGFSGLIEIYFGCFAFYRFFGFELFFVKPVFSQYEPNKLGQ